MEGDASPRFPPDDRIPDVPANDPIPSGELIDARYFLSGWTLARYTERFRIESGDGEASSADDLGDGATPVGSGAFGWTAEGPPGRRRARRRRLRGVLTIPTRATVGQVRYRRGPLGSSQVLTLVAPDFSGPRLCAISPPRTCSPRPPWTPPRASTPGGSASAPCSSRSSPLCTPRSLTRSSYHRQGEVSSSTCFCLFFFFHRAFIIALFLS